MPASQTDSFNPYQIPAGRELDAYVHYQVLKNALSHEYPHYSSDPSEADNLKRKIEADYKIQIICGRSTVDNKPWFARYEIDAGNPTEVLAETYPLAICRLAILRVRRG